MKKEDKYNLIKNDYAQLQKGLIIFWIKDLLSQLKNAFINNKYKERIGERYGVDFSYYLISKSFTRLNQKRFQELLKNPSHKLFIFDIKAILTNTNILDKKSDDENLDNINNSIISDSFIDNNKKVLNILNELSQDKNNTICLITNESKDFNKDINLNPNNFYLVAEDGLVTKPIWDINFKNK